MGKLHICKYCGVETNQPDEECYAKPKQEISYSEEEVKEMIIDAINSCTDGVSSHCQDFDEWFIQNKK